MSEPQDKATTESEQLKKKEVSPLSCFFASIVSGGIATMVYSLMKAIANTYADKPIVGNSALALKIATLVRTLVVGIAALGAGVFALVAVGLFLLGIQLTMQKMTNKA